VASPGVLVMSQRISFDPTAASTTQVRVGNSPTAGATFVLPKGSIPIEFVKLTDSTGGTTPTVDIGHSADLSYFANEMASDGGVSRTLFAGNSATDGAASGTTADFIVTAGAGASAATGGTITGTFIYSIVDDGKDSA